MGGFQNADSNIVTVVWGANSSLEIGLPTLRGPSLDPRPSEMFLLVMTGKEIERDISGTFYGSYVYVDPGCWS